MPVRILKKGPPAPADDLSLLEQKLGCPIPKDFLSFISENHGGTPETNEFDIPDTGNGSGIDTFFSVREMLDLKERYASRFLTQAWPIAHAEGGNYLCLVCKDKPGIYFWDHELEQEEDSEPTWDNMFLLARTFGEFWQALKKFDVHAVQLKPGQVISTWSDPDFKPEFD